MRRVLRSLLDTMLVPGNDPRDAVFDGLRASTADEVTAQGQVRERVEALLGAGKTLDQSIAGAVRVAAVF